MSIKNIEKEQSYGEESYIPFYTSGIGTRISEASEVVGGKKRLAEVIEISESQLHRVISGGSKAKIETIAAIAKQTGVNLEWLATGEGPKWASESQEQGKRQSTGESGDDFWWYETADDQAAIDLLIDVGNKLDITGQFPVTEIEMTKNQSLRESRAKLRGLYENRNIDPKLKTKIDLMLRLFFEDPAAEHRMQERMANLRVRSQRASSIVEAVIKAIGWEPPLEFKETIKLAVFEGELHEKTVFNLISTIHKTVVAKDT